MNILVLIKDLVLSTQIRGACEAKSISYISGRSNEKFEKALTDSNPAKVIIDLNIEGADPFKAIEAAKSSLSIENIICFYSHVNTELAEKALELGLKGEQVYRRSKFFSDIAAVIS